MITVRGETYNFDIVERKLNSAYEYENIVSCSFKGRPANNMEKKLYRIDKGVESSTDSVYVITSNLPEELKVGDNIMFIGKLWTVASIGYYFDNNLIVNAGVMKDDYLINRCPKGIVIG